MQKNREKRRFREISPLFSSLKFFALAAEQTGLDREFISDINRNSPALLKELYLSKNAVCDAVIAQKKIIERIAQNGSCVIVGRAADYILKEYQDVVRTFVGAPLDFRVNRVSEKYGDTKEQAESNIANSDKARAAYYKSISGWNWGDPQYYDLVLDGSRGVEECTDEILTFLSDRRK